MGEVGESETHQNYECCVAGWGWIPLFWQQAGIHTVNMTHWVNMRCISGNLERVAQAPGWSSSALDGIYEGMVQWIVLTVERGP